MTIRENEKAVDGARAALSLAEKERPEAEKRLQEEADALENAEAAYDATATDANGARVITARQARDLAALRAERAQRREADARAALETAERALERARLEGKLSEAERREADARRALEEARAHMQHAHPAPAIAQVVTYTSDRERKAYEEREKALEELAAARRLVEEAEANALAAALPERARELEARRAARKSEDINALVEGAAFEALKAQIDPSVAVIVAAERLIREHVERIAAVVDRARAAALRARELGANVEPVDEHHKLSHVIHASFIATPEELQNWNEYNRRMSVLFRFWSEPFPQQEHYKLILDGRKPGASERSVAKSQIERLAQPLKCGTLAEARRIMAESERRQKAEEQESIRATYVPPTNDRGVVALGEDPPSGAMRMTPALPLSAFGRAMDAARDILFSGDADVTN